MPEKRKQGEKHSQKVPHFNKVQIKHDPQAESARAKFGKKEPE